MKILHGLGKFTVVRIHYNYITMGKFFENWLWYRMAAPRTNRRLKSFEVMSQQVDFNRHKIRLDKCFGGILFSYSSLTFANSSLNLVSIDIRTLT